MECSPLVESEKDCNYLHVKAVEEEQNLKPEVGEPVDVDAHVQKKVYEFYFIKFRPSKHQNVISRIEKAEKLIEEINQEADPMTRKWTKSTVSSRLWFTLNIPLFFKKKKKKIS